MLTNLTLPAYSPFWRAVSKNLSGWYRLFRRRPCGDLRSPRACKAGAWRILGDSGRFASFPKAPPLSSWGLGAELTWPAPKKRIPPDPLQTDFLESQPSKGVCVSKARNGAGCPRPFSGLAGGRTRSKRLTHAPEHRQNRGSNVPFLAFFKSCLGAH